jgi:hypothetical protein
MHGLQLLQQRGDGRRALSQALQAVGKTGIEDATAFLAERVHLEDDSIRRRFTNRQHPHHVVGFVSMLNTHLVSGCAGDCNSVAARDILNPQQLTNARLANLSPMAKFWTTDFPGKALRNCWRLLTGLGLEAAFVDLQ